MMVMKKIKAVCTRLTLPDDTVTSVPFMGMVVSPVYGNGQIRTSPIYRNGLLKPLTSVYRNGQIEILAIYGNGND